MIYRGEYEVPTKYPIKLIVDLTCTKVKLDNNISIATKISWYS